MDAKQMGDLVNRLQEDIMKWEGQGLEFMEDYPNQARDIAKEIAAFATSNSGTIYLGVAEDRSVVGISADSDAVQDRIAGVCQKTIKPAVVPTIEFMKVDNKLVCRIDISDCSEPVYYVNNVPYIRNLTTSEPATPDQVKEIYRKHLLNEILAVDRMRPRGA